MEIHLGCVVEGAGEEGAVPILVRAIAARVDPTLFINIPRPVRIRRTKLHAKFGELERGIQLAVRNLRKKGGLFILLDSEGEAPCQLGPELVKRAVQSRGDVPVGVVLAHREYEAWFLAAAESLRGQRDLDAGFTTPADPEAIQDAKGWLRKHMPANRKYSEREDQPALTARLDLEGARQRSPSFDKCWREVAKVITELRDKGQLPSDSETKPES